MQKSDRSAIRGVIDRFEGDFAVIIAGEEGDERLEIPKSVLPLDSREGSIVELKIKVKKNKDKEAREKVKGMIEKLSKND